MTQGTPTAGGRARPSGQDPLDAAHALLEEYAWAGPDGIAEVLNVLPGDQLDRVCKAARRARMRRHGLLTEVVA